MSRKFVGRAILLVFASFWVWVTISMLSQGSASVGVQLYDRAAEAFDATVIAASLIWSASVAISRSLYLWSIVFAPFVQDLGHAWMNYGFPCVKVAIAWLVPYLHALGLAFLEKLHEWPLEISSSVVWIPFCLICSKLISRKFLHGLLLPIVWSSWRLLPVGNRIPLKLAAVAFPVVLSLWRFKTHSVALVALISYWLLFPVLVWADRLIYPLMGQFGGLYMSTAAVLLPWAIITGETSFIVDLVDLTKWTDYVVSTWKFLLGGSSSRWVSAVYSGAAAISRLREMSSMYQIGIFIFFSLAAIYWAFSIFQKLAAVLVWPWFFLEIGKVCVTRTISMYRQSLSFSLLFLGLEFVAVPFAPVGLSAILAFFHFPLVFGFKLASEPILDFLISCTLPKSKETWKLFVSTRSDSKCLDSSLISFLAVSELKFPGSHPQ